MNKQEKKVTINNRFAEQIYLDVYSEAAENADYLQPSRGIDFLLPETIIAVLTSTILVSFLQGFSAEFAKIMADIVKERVFKQGKLKEIPAEDLIKLLETHIDQLKADQEKLTHAEQQVEADLCRLGIPPKAAKRIAKKTRESVTHKN
jgi:hypothetical protein